MVRLLENTPQIKKECNIYTPSKGKVCLRNVHTPSKGKCVHAM